ncbi:hypothetical protein FS837_000894 [Tulasnella sp. UAMH 9824]|nr:hypothetical protein FS837_000894 [Tulasnella sp. UAMH 9824]
MRENSSTDSRDDICFTGTDGLTCHQFIRAIREHALEAEKQQDNRWIADYASIRFGGEALKWFETLDDETQIDWKLLRRAILVRYSEPTCVDAVQAEVGQSRAKDPVFVFAGKDKDECRAFVQEIRLRAYREGKEAESEWMVKLAFPCFASKALDWYAGLPQDVRRDWSRLERALLLDYPTAPTFSISPARARIENWYQTVAPSQSLQTVRSRDDWLAQARERRRMYLETGDKFAPYWLLVETEEEIPEEATITGSDLSGNPLYSARLWYGEHGLLVGKCGRHIPGDVLRPNSSRSLGHSR